VAAALPPSSASHAPRPSIASAARAAAAAHAAAVARAATPPSRESMVTPPLRAPMSTAHGPLPTMARAQPPSAHGRHDGRLSNGLNGIGQPLSAVSAVAAVVASRHAAEVARNASDAAHRQWEAEVQHAADAAWEAAAIALQRSFRQLRPFSPRSVIGNGRAAAAPTSAVVGVPVVTAPVVTAPVVAAPVMGVDVRGSRLPQQRALPQAPRLLINEDPTSRPSIFCRGRGAHIGVYMS